MAQKIPGTLITTDGAEGAAEQAATRLADILREALSTRGGAALALSGGNTPRSAYALLAKEPDIDWPRVHVFWVDERVAAPTDDRSNYHWAKVTLLDAVPVPPDHIHRMPTDAPDLAAAAREYERAVRAHVPPDQTGAPSFDAVVLGVGDDGHTASLFPGEPTVDVRDRLVAAVPARAATEARLTMTAPVIEHARHVLVLAVGAAKRIPLQRAWDDQGSVRETPARVIRGCQGALVWIVDGAAAGTA